MNRPTVGGLRRSGEELLQQAVNEIHRAPQLGDLLALPIQLLLQLGSALQLRVESAAHVVELVLDDGEDVGPCHRWTGGAFGTALTGRASLPGWSALPCRAPLACLAARRLGHASRIGGSLRGGQNHLPRGWTYRAAVRPRTDSVNHAAVASGVTVNLPARGSRMRPRLPSAEGARVRARYPLTMTDFATRFVLACDALGKSQSAFAFTVFERTFQQYALPLAIRTQTASLPRR